MCLARLRVSSWRDSGYTMLSLVSVFLSLSAMNKMISHYIHLIIIIIKYILSSPVCVIVGSSTAHTFLALLYAPSIVTVITILLMAWSMIMSAIVKSI